ncbi:MAG: GNAT family N-acetyltransferase [Syntrophomonas sp.]|nr:GNAT family N-acetyltransferase [Syntrophomonas sp.]
MDNDIFFEELKEEYLDKILQIYTHYVLNTTATFHTQAPTRDQMRQIVFLNNKRYKTFAILANKQINGYVLTTQYKNREAYDTTAEVSIYLQPEAVGRGIGSQALAFIEDYAKKQDIHVLLAVICGQNEASIKLFSKNGYFKCAHYKEVGKKFGQILDSVSYQKIIG